jgi:acyl carrier protein
MSTLASAGTARDTVRDTPPDAEEIAEWLARYISQALGLAVDTIDRRAPFEMFGFDSAASVMLTGELGDWLKVAVDPLLAYDYPSIHALSRQLSALVGGAR